MTKAAQTLYAKHGMVELLRMEEELRAKPSLSSAARKRLEAIGEAVRQHMKDRVWR